MMSRRSFTCSALLQVLRGLPTPERYLVALSGGLDSMVLLHALSRLRQELAPIRIGAVHVHHGLSGRADDWAGFCGQVCEDLDIPLLQLRVDARPPAGRSAEDWARRQRYGAISERLGRGDILLTAHHQDDQAETLMLRLLRGAGARGLAAMARLRTLPPGRLARPLLEFSREQLRAYAEGHALRWVDDESNLDTRFDRNFLRHEVMPVLLRRWPAGRRSLSRAAAIQADNAALLDELAAADMQVATRGGGPRLSITALRGLGRRRCRNLLRYWIRQAGFRSPSWRQLRQFERDVLGASAASAAHLHWPEFDLRRYRDEVWILAPSVAHDPGRSHSWSFPGVLMLAHGALEASPAQGQGLSCRACDGGRISVRFRRGGERLRLPGRAGTRALKKLLQEAGIPPWERDRLPLVYVDDELAAVADRWVCADFAAAADEAGWLLDWHPLAERDKDADDA